MRIIKLLSLVTALCLAATSVAGCKSTSEYSSSVLDKENHATALKQFWGELYDMPYTSTDDLEYHYSDSYGGIVITDYLGNDDNVKIPDEIDGQAVTRVDLKYCYKNIKALMLPDTVSYVKLAGYDDIVNYIKDEDYTHHWHLSYYYVSELDGVVINDYTGTSKYVRIPETILDPDTHKEYSVRKISFMERHKDIDHLIIPDSVKYVYADPYDDVIVPESEINEEVSDTYFDAPFYENIGVEKMNIPAALSQDNGLMFAQSTLKSVYIPDNFQTLPNGMFQESELLCEVTLGGNDIDIQDNAFYKCSSLTGFEFSKAISIGSSAFYGCTGIERANLNPSLSKIGAGAFTNCVNLTDITIPSSVKEIGNNAFENCRALKSLTVEKGNMFYYSENNVIYSKETSKPIGYKELVNS